MSETATGGRTGAGAQGIFRVKVSAFGKETKLRDVTPGQTVSQVATAAEFDFTGKEFRVDSRPVTADYVLQPHDAVVVIAPKIAAGA